MASTEPGSPEEFIARSLATAAGAKVRHWFARKRLTRHIGREPKVPYRALIRLGADFENERNLRFGWIGDTITGIQLESCLAGCVQGSIV
jgi:hypothetical protein